MKECKEYKEYNEYEEINSFKKRKHSEEESKTLNINLFGAFKVSTVLLVFAVIVAIAAVNSPDPVTFISKLDTSAYESTGQYKLEHEFEPWVITSQADCHNEGTRQRRCSVCGEIQKEIIPSFHHEVILTKIDATCDKEGLSEGLWCDLCKTILIEQTTIPKLDHIFDDGVIEKQPTCLENGTVVFTCTLCKKTKTETISDKNGHITEILSGYAASCTKPGLTNGERCTLCHKIIVPQKTIESSGHHIVSLAAVSPTCISGGHGEGRWCDVCGTIIDSGVQYGPTGHHIDWSSYSIVSMETCTTPRVIATPCLNCGELAYDIGLTPPPGHIDSDSDSFCDVCGEPV